MLEEEGLLGIFLVSLFSHLTVVGRDLFTPAFVALIDRYHPALLGFSAGLGGAIGEVTAYYWGLGIREAFRDSSEKSTMYKWVEKYGLLMILVVAASPLPDVPIALLAGSARFSLKKFLLVEAVGKSAYYSVGASVGGYIFQLLIGTVDRWMLSLIVVLASILLCVTISWSKSREKIIQIFRKLPRDVLGKTFEGTKRK